MSTESQSYELVGLDVMAPTEKLVAVARNKYVQRWVQDTDRDQTISQTLFPMTHDLSIVIPTRNEHDNVRPLLEALSAALQGLSVEVIFVDDSDDDTPEIIKDVTHSMGTHLFQICLEHRSVGSARFGGLATAVVHGMSKAQAQYVAVIDADLQHPPEQLRVFYDHAVAHDVDLVLASRYIKGGSYKGLAGVGRRIISVGLKWTAKLLFPERLWRISDPLGGFFLLRRELLTDVPLRPIGYKILLELLLRCQWQSVLEVPYHFRTRAHGQSKATMKQGMMALQHMVRLLLEVPTAGRAWKISFILLLNIVITLLLLLLHTFFMSISTNINVITFAVMACLDFVIFNRFIFPTPIVSSPVGISLPFGRDIQLVNMVTTPLREYVEDEELEAEERDEELEEDEELAVEHIDEEPSRDGGIVVEGSEEESVQCSPSADLNEGIVNIGSYSNQGFFGIGHMKEHRVLVQCFPSCDPLDVSDWAVVDRQSHKWGSQRSCQTAQSVIGVNLYDAHGEVGESFPSLYGPRLRRPSSMQINKSSIFVVENIDEGAVPLLVVEPISNGVEASSDVRPVEETEIMDAGRMPGDALTPLVLMDEGEEAAVVENIDEEPSRNEEAPLLVNVSQLEAPSTQLVVVLGSKPKQKLQPKPRKRVFKKSPFGSRKQFSRKMLSVVSVLAVFLACGWIAHVIPGLLAVIAALCIGAAIAFTKNVKRDQMVTMLLAIAVGVASIDYLSWRFVVTNWPAWWISGPLLFAEVLGAIHAFGFQFTVWPWPTPKVGYNEDPTQHPIFIFIPTVNEGVAILRPTLEGVISARDKYLAHYPYAQVTIVVCNDGRVAQVANWDEIDILAEELGVTCVTRTQKGGAKAGNIENARQELHATHDALLVIFDADQIAKPDFLLKTILPFRDSRMGWVQTGQYYSNLDNPVSRWADDQQSMFYNLLCPGKAALNAAFICGTNVVIRAAALDEIGGLPQDSVTEDFAASIALHPSWRSIYLTGVLATGMGPLDVPSYLKQQSRWAMGTLDVFRTHWREILLPKKNGLHMAQRVQYFLACTHYLCGVRDLIYLISPILFIFTGVPAVRGSTLGAFLLHFLPYCVLSFTALWYSSRGITGLRGIILGFGSFPVLIGSLFSVILRRKVGFSVTSKQHGGKRSLRYLWVYYFFFLLCIACLVWATQVKGHEQTSLFISILWVLYSMVMISGFLVLSFKDMRYQRSVQRTGVLAESSSSRAYPEKLLKRKRGLHPVWNLGLAALIACPMLINGSLTIFANANPKPFLIGQEKIAAPYFGVSLPVQLLASQPGRLESDLSTRFGIIGRTQDIHDQFDLTWANGLAAEHVRPWITLQFGVFGPKNKPPLDADFPAIINGLHDQEIKRWAESVRSYGKPVYLTVFLHADRNWSLTSGVANGGIPQDVAEAWVHVQSIFRQVGASNAAWVWAAADPLHDQKYAPPPATIDAVLQSFIDYPGTKWGDPKTVLRDLTKRYPGKPIIVEASVSGPAPQKAAWLTKLGTAIITSPDVYALLYHEGGPELNATSAQIKSWSLASDPTSLAVMRSIVVSLQK